MSDFEKMLAEIEERDRAAMDGPLSVAAITLSQADVPRLLAFVKAAAHGFDSLCTYDGVQQEGHCPACQYLAIAAAALKGE